MLKFEISLLRAANDAADAMLFSSVKELTAQGYVNTGKGVESLQKRVIDLGQGQVEIQIVGEKYLIYLDTGTKPHFPPISVIYKYAKQRGIGSTDEETMSAAWGIATNIAKHGTPTPNSYQYISNGERTEWTYFAMEEARGNIVKIFEGSDWIQSLFDDAFKQD